MSARIQKRPLLFLMMLFVFSSISLGNEKTAVSAKLLHLLEVDSVYEKAKSNFSSYVAQVYRELNDTSLSYELFKEGLTGYHNLEKRKEIGKEDVLTLIDFSKPSNQKRLYIIDLCKRKIIHRSIVAHGVNSGGLYARHFSNENNSRQSSLGFYVTTTTYSGKYDLALRLKGMEYSNSRASSRGVVMHAAKYATYEFLEQNGGTLGRSFGCPALPYDKFHQVVDWIKEGSCLYIYYPSSSYKRHSKYLNRKNYLEDFIEL